MLFSTCFQYVAVDERAVEYWQEDKLWHTNWSLHHVKGRKREVKEWKEEEAEEWRKRNEKDRREGRLCVKGQNVMFLINYSTCHEKKQDEIFSPHCPLIESDTLCSKDGGKRHEDKTGLKIHQRDGQISSSGQLAGRNSPPPTTRQQERITLCLSDSCLYPLLLLPVHSLYATHAHPFNSYMNKLHSCNSLFCSCHLSVRLSAHICPGRTHIQTHALTRVRTV